MNKNKKHLEELRRHLGRDAAGIAMLDQTARDLNELRQRAAALKESEAQAAGRAQRDRQKLIDAERTLTETKAELEREKGRRQTAERTADSYADRLLVLEMPDEDEPKLSASDWDSKVLGLFKTMRRQFGNPPKVRDPKVFVVRVEDLCPELTHDQLHSLGVFVAMMAIIGKCPDIWADRHVRDMDWAKRRGKMVQLAKWIGQYTAYSTLETELCGPPISGVTIPFPEEKEWRGGLRNEKTNTQ